jgi:hypothetical protein
MVIHTTVQFGLDTSERDADELAFGVILPQLHILLPQLPKAAFTVTQRWQYSQVRAAVSWHYYFLLICRSLA